MQYTCVEGDGSEGWLKYNDEDTFGAPIICTGEDLDWAMEYLWERCRKVVIDE